MRTIVNRINKGFTLLEIMATLLVMAIIITLALPSYEQYQARAKMVEVIKILDDTLDAARSSYMAGQGIPTSVLGYPSGAFTAYTNSPYVAYIYYDDGSTWNNTGKAAMVQAVIAPNLGDGISGFAAGTSGTSNRVSMAFVVSGEVLTQYCGSWVDDGTQIPSSYLPSGCQADAFETTITG